jgi:hypothetical protein
MLRKQIKRYKEIINYLKQNQGKTLFYHPKIEAYINEDIEGGENEKKNLNFEIIMLVLVIIFLFL